MIKTLQTILRQDRERFIIPKEVQEIIPVNRIWSDGTFKFSDINYAMLSKEDTQTLFLKYCDLINSFECGSTYKLTIALSRYNQKALNESIIMPMCNDDMDRFRKESNARFMDEAIGAAFALSYGKRQKGQHCRRPSIFQQSRQRAGRLSLSARFKMRRA